MNGFIPERRDKGFRVMLSKHTLLKDASNLFTSLPDQYAVSVRYVNGSIYT